MKEDPADISLLRATFNYDPKTGVLSHAAPRSGARVGARAGSLKRDGYRVASFRSRPFREHRLIFAYMEGRWPTTEIDHVNGVRDDNRWVNLREAMPAQNQANTHYRSKSGLKGAYFNVRANRWHSLISVGGRVRHLGYFDTKEEAHAAYSAAATAQHGDFARTSPSLGQMLS